MKIELINSRQTTLLMQKMLPSFRCTERGHVSQSFLVPFKKIKENDWDFSINRYKEIVYEEVEYNKPEVIIGRIKKLNQERDILLKSLIQ